MEAPEVPEGSNFFLNVLREASPLAASFGKLHLCRGGGFLKEAREDGLISSSTHRLPEDTRVFPPEVKLFEGSTSFGKRVPRRTRA